jgi:hypothetical protein
MAPESTEQQEHERRFIADRFVLAQDIGVLVAGVDLDVGIGVVLSRLRSVNPGDVKVQDSGAVGKPDLARGHVVSGTHRASRSFPSR